MSTTPTDLRYTTDHEWIRATGTICRVGITQFAVDQLGDITLVELPKVGATMTKGDRFGTVESVKSVSDLFAPITGTVTAVNDALKDGPELVNTEPYAGGWMIELTPTTTADADALLSPDAYDALLAAQ